MTPRLIIRAQAEADIADAALYYENQQAGLGEQFLAEIDALIQRIASGPRQFQCLRRVPDVRRALAKRFPYRVFFVLRPDKVVVVFRVLHTARHDREWKSTLPGD